MNNNKTIVTWCFLLFNIFLCYFSSATAAESIEIIPKQRVFIAQERGIITLPFTLINRENTTQQLIESIELPNGWRQLSSSTSFSLLSGKKTVRLIHLLASSGVPSGRYTITYQLSDKNDGRIISKQNVSIEIKKNTQLNVDILDKPNLVLAGETYQIKLKVKNKGNTPLALTVNATDRLRYITKLSPKKLSLAPAESSIVTLTAVIPSNIDNIATHSINFSFKGDTLLLNKKIKTKLISQTPVGLGKYHKLQTNTTFDYTSNGTSNNFQSEFKASGSLDIADEHYIDLFLRNNKSSQSLLTSSSQQYLSYKNKNLDVHLGDRSFSVDGVSDSSFYGRGAEINYHPTGQSWNIRTFDAEEGQQKYSNDTQKSSLKGAEISYRFDNNLEISGNFSQKTDEKNSQLNENIIGINTHWYKDRTLNIDLSYSQDKDGKAYRIQQDGMISDTLRYNIEAQRASAKFDGEIKDIQSQSTTGIYNFDKNKYLRGHLSHQQRNLDKDISRQILKEKEAQFGIGYYFDDGHRESLYAETFIKTKEDLRKVSNLKQTNTGLRLDYKKYLDTQWAANASLGLQQQHNQFSNKKSSETSQSLTIAYSPDDKYRMAFNVDAKQYSEKRNTLQYGLNASGKINDLQTLSAYWRHLDNSNGGSDTFEAKYTHKLKQGSQLSVSVLKENANNTKNDISYRLSLSIPFGMPLYKRGDIASVKGQVLNAKTQQGIANAIIKIAGQYAISNNKGYYEFPSIPAGSYAINIDLSRTKQENFMLSDNQQAIKLSPKQKLTHNISLTQGTGLQGNIIKYIGSNKTLIETKHDKLSPSGGIAGLLVTISRAKNKQKIYKTLSLENGYFSFSGLEAGKWQVQISDPKKQMKGFRLRKSTQVIKLIINKENNIQFKAIPFIKTIKKIGPSTGFSVSSE